MLELCRRKTHRTRSGSGCGIDHIEATQRLVEVHVAAVVDAKGADTAHPMSYELLGLVRREHLCLGVELVLELTIVNARVTGKQHQRHALTHMKGQRLGNTCRLAAHRLCCQLHRGARLLELHDAIFHAKAGQMRPRTLDCQDDLLHQSCHQQDRIPAAFAHHRRASAYVPEIRLPYNDTHTPSVWSPMEQQLVARLTELRRDLHQIPEVDFDLPKTLAYVRSVLDPLAQHATAQGHRIEVFSPARSTVCAFFDRGTSTATAIRTDMDALPVTECTGAPYASTHEGKMHACGHDGHMAMALALAEILEQRFDELDESVLVVFQPAEETTGGAKLVCESGVFDQLHVRRIFGFHLWPDLPKGMLASRAGALLAASNETTVTFTGVGSHIAKAEQGRDSLEAGCRFLARAYDYLERRQAEEPCLLKFGRMESGTVRNQISAHTVLEGSLRTFSLTMRERCQADLQVIAARCAGEAGCSVKVHFSEGYPPVVNDVTVFTQAASALPELQELPEPLLIAEDFAWYQQWIPGVFLLLGTGTGIPLHADTFDFDEAILAKGVDAYLRLLGLA